MFKADYILNLIVYVFSNKVAFYSQYKFNFVEYKTLVLFCNEISQMGKQYGFTQVLNPNFKILK